MRRVEVAQTDGQREPEFREAKSGWIVDNRINFLVAQVSVAIGASLEALFPDGQNVALVLQGPSEAVQELQVEGVPKRLELKPVRGVGCTGFLFFAWSGKEKTISGIENVGTAAPFQICIVWVVPNDAGVGEVMLDGNLREPISLLNVVPLAVC